MSSKVRRKPSPPVSPGEAFESLYHDLLKHHYENDDRARAEKVAARLEPMLTASPELAYSIRGEEVRSLIAELRGDYVQATRSREAEIRKILELHAQTANTPHWPYVSRRYGWADVSDRLDLLAILYDEQGDTDRAIAVLEESKSYCAAHGIPFDAQDLLNELQQARAAGAVSGL